MKRFFLIFCKSWQNALRREVLPQGDKDIMPKSDELELQNFDIEIRADGRWFQEGGEIKRLGLVKLFASVLSCDDAGRYWLTTPVEKGEIRVQDAPFVIQALRCEGTGAAQVIYLQDNIEREHKLCSANPLEMRLDEAGHARPFIRLEKGLCALIKHAVFYELAEIALAAAGEGQSLDELDEENLNALVIYSDGAAFSLMPQDA